MPTFLAGATSRRGFSLLELLIVVTLIGLVSGLSYPSAVAGIDSLRLRSTSDQVVSFLNTALDRATRKQQVVELRISPAENALSARTADMSFERRMEVQNPVHIVSVGSSVPGSAGQAGQRRFLIYPGGTIPRIDIELSTNDGRKRRISVDPLSGIPRAGDHP